MVVISLPNGAEKAWFQDDSGVMREGFIMPDGSAYMIDKYSKTVMVNLKNPPKTTKFGEPLTEQENEPETYEPYNPKEDELEIVEPDNNDMQGEPKGLKITPLLVGGIVLLALLLLLLFLSNDTQRVIIVIFAIILLLVGFLAKSAISGREIDVPQDVRNMLLFDEKVICGYQQAGLWGNFGGLESIFATDRRLIRYKPKTFGLRADIEDYLYKDIANIKLNRGILRSNISIVMRFNAEPMKIMNIPRSGIERLFKIIQDGIAGRLEVPTGTPSTGMSSNQINIADKIRQLKELKDSGHISDKEYQEKKNELLNRL